MYSMTHQYYPPSTMHTSSIDFQWPCDALMLPNLHFCFMYVSVGNLSRIFSLMAILTSGDSMAKKPSCIALGKPGKVVQGSAFSFNHCSVAFDGSLKT